MSARGALPFQKGVNFTAEGPVGYSLRGSAAMLDRLRAYGVDAIALVPYGMCRRGETAIRFNFGMERAELVTAVAKAVHERGMRVLLKPQIWVPGRAFPGDLEFADEALRAAWFREYARFLSFYASLAAAVRADVFCVGSEFVRLSRHEHDWRALIAPARWP